VARPAAREVRVGGVRRRAAELVGPDDRGGDRASRRRRRHDRDGPRAANAKDAAVCTLSEEQPLIESVEAKPSGDAARATRREEPVEDETLADAASEIFAQSVAIARRQVEIALQSDELLRRFQGRLRATLDRQRLLIAAIKSGQHNGAVDGQERLRLESAPVDATRRQPEHRGQQRPEFGSTALGPKPSATESPPSDGNNHHASPKLPPTQPVVKATTYSRGAPPPRRASPRPSATRVVARNNELESHLTSSSALTAGAMNMLAMSCGDENRPCGQTHAATSLGLSRAHLGGSSLALANGLGPARNGDARAMQYEMESHMSMHREMLLRKTDQLTLFETDDPASAAVPPLDASSWNLEADIDDELFHFLAE